MPHRNRRPRGNRHARPRCEPHGKEMFRTRKAAINALAGYATNVSGPDKDYHPRRAYPAECGYWHLSSRP
jgi:hypothetical protein